MTDVNDLESMERFIDKKVEPLNKQISMLQIELEGVKKQLTIPDVVGRSEQLVCKCGLPKDKKGGNFNCLRTDCNMTIAN